MKTKQTDQGGEILVVYTSYLWQEMRGDSVYGIQIEDPEIYKRARQRKDFSLVLWGLNKNIWVFKTHKNTPQAARRTFASITRSKIKKDVKNGVFYAETHTYIAPKTKP